MNSDTHASKLVPCPTCAALNRVPLASIGQTEAKCGKCKTPLIANKSVYEVSGPALEKLIVNSPIPVVTDFWAPWCGPCLAFAPTFEQCANNHPGSALYLKLNTEDHPETSAKLGIRGIPTLIIFEGEKEKARQSGAMPMPQLKSWLQSKGVAL